MPLGIFRVATFGTGEVVGAPASAPAGDGALAYSSVVTNDEPLLYWDFKGDNLAVGGGFASSKYPGGVSQARTYMYGASTGQASSLAAWDNSLASGGLLFEGAADRTSLGAANASIVGITNLWDSGGTVEWMQKAYGSGGSSYPRVLYHNDSAVNGWEVYYQSTVSFARHVFRIGFTGGTKDWFFETDIMGSTTVALGSVYHCALTYDADSVSNRPILYINGKAHQSTGADPSGTRKSNSGSGFRIGNWNTPFDRAFDGVIDEVSMYASILPQDRVSQHSFAALGWNYGQLCLQYGAEALYPLNEDNAYTSVIAYNHASTANAEYVGNPSRTTSMIGEGGAHSFASVSSQYVSTPYSGVSGSGNRTLCAWISTSASSYYQGVMAYGSNVSGKRFMFGTDVNDAPAAFFNGSNRIGRTNIQDGNRHFICCVLDGTQAQDIDLYVDGDIEATASSVNPTNTLNTSDTDVGIGYDKSASTFYFQGKIEGAAFFASALTSTQISELYQAGTD